MEDLLLIVSDSTSPDPAGVPAQRAFPVLPSVHHVTFAVGISAGGTGFLSAGVLGGRPVPHGPVEACHGEASTGTSGRITCQDGHVPTRRVLPRPVAGTRSVATGVASLVPDTDGRRGWTLFVNGMESSHVDLDDPTRLDFEYIRWLVAGIESLPVVARPAEETDTWRILHLGGGGCTLPRYLAAAHDRARQVVVELDPGVLELSQQAFGLRSRARLRLRIGEARAAVTAEADAGCDVVVRDAFIGSNVPPHLLTRQFVAEVARILRPGGLYVANLADGELLATARREVATAQQSFAHVALVAEPGQLRGRRYGNVVIAASHSPLPVVGWARRLASDPVRARLVDGEAARAFGSGRHPFDDADLEPGWFDPAHGAPAGSTTVSPDAAAASPVVPATEPIAASAAPARSSETLRVTRSAGRNAPEATSDNSRG